MHEMHIVRDLFDDLIKRIKENNATRVTRVYVKMGEFTEINEEILKFFFEQEGKGTPLEEAEIDIERSPTRELRLLSFDCE